MPLHLVSDANITAISIVDKGANRKRFFLRKADGEEAEPLPPAGRIVKAKDWSAVYCVVAEPGWAENPGQGAEHPDIDDVWQDEDEIRKAAHRFMANGGLVNKLHESLEPYGQLVENAVALADFEVDGDVIRKGSWYIAIAPSSEGKAAIDKGEFTGVSIEGTARRTLVEKKKFTAAERQKLASKGHALPDGSFPISTVADLKNAVQAFGRGKNKAKVKAHIVARARALGATDKLPDEWKVKKGSTSSARTVGAVDKSLLQKIAEKVGISAEEVDAINKSNRTFGEIVASREFDKALPDAFDAFQSAIWNAFFPAPGEEVNPVALITESCDEFKAWTLDKLEAVPVAKAERGEALGVDPDGSSAQIPTFESEETDMGLTEKETERIEKLETAVTAIGEGVAKLIEKADAEPAEEKAPTAEELTKQLGEVTESVKDLGEKIAKLGEGGTSQVEKTEEEKSVDAERVEKTFKREGVNPALAGILGA